MRYNFIFIILLGWFILVNAFAVLMVIRTKQLQTQIDSLNEAMANSVTIDKQGMEIDKRIIELLSSEE